MTNTITKATTVKLHSYAAIYSQLVSLLREAGDKRLTALADSADKSLTQLNEMLANEVDAKTGREILKGLRQGLREMPKLLASIVPECGRQLVSEFESKLGGKFSEF